MEIVVKNNSSIVPKFWLLEVRLSKEKMDGSVAYDELRSESLANSQDVNREWCDLDVAISKSISFCDFNR